MTMNDTENIVRLPEPPPVEPAPRPTPPGRAHGASIAGMGISAIVGVVAMLAFITVTWPENIGRIVIGICLLSGLAFLSFASIAVISAARDTYRSEVDRKTSG